MNWRLSDHNPLKVGLISVAVILVVLVASLNLKTVAFWSRPHTYAAYLTNASGLSVGDSVEIRGVGVGEVKKITVHGNTVRVDFGVDKGVRLGADTTAAVKVLNPLGTVYLAVLPQGSGSLSVPIPTSRTAVSMSLLGDLGQVSKQVGELDMAQLKKALDVTSTNLSATSGQAVQKALTGLSEFSGTLAAHSKDIEALVSKGSDIARILADRKDQLVNLVGQGQTLMAVLKERQGDIAALLHGTAALAQEVSRILEVNRAQLNPMLRDLQQVSDVLAKENDNIEKTLPALARLSGHVAAATGNGPFLDVVVPNGLLPDALIQQCKAGAYPAPDKPIVGCRP